MKYLYRYTPHNTGFKYEVISQSQLWFAKVETFNDPIDSQLDYRQEYTEKEIKIYWESFLKNNPKYSETLDKCGNNESFIEQQNRIFKEQKSHIGVLCFSENPNNILMWSHYANNHKGIVYEFKANLFFNSRTNSFNGFPYKVNYPSDRSYPLLSYTLIGDQRNKQFADELLSKAKDWEYEEEYRFIDIKNNSDQFCKQYNGNKTFNQDALTSIIFGVKTPTEEIDVIKSLCKKHELNHITFKQAQFIKGKFEIEIIEI